MQRMKVCLVCSFMCFLLPVGISAMFYPGDVTHSSQWSSSSLDPPFWEGEVTLIRYSTINIVAHTSGDTYGVSGTTALSALHKASLMGNFSYTVDDRWYEQFDSLLVDSIGGKANEAFDGWQFWVNYPSDQIPIVGADKYQLSEGDFVDFFYGGFGVNPQSSSMVIKIHIHLDNDVTPPHVEIVKPQKGLLYLANRELFRLPGSSIIVLGGISVEVDARDELTEITNVEFYIDGQLRSQREQPPFEWAWSEKTFGRYILQVIGYDQAENFMSDEISLWMVPL